MTEISFLIFCDSSRVDNLHQVLRFLARREKSLIGRAEFVVICQDQIDPAPLPLPVRIVNLRLPEFNKPVMVNAAVREASADVIVILDGDRILPEGYFADALGRHRPGLIQCPERLYKLDKSYSDAEIESGLVVKNEDFRTVEAVPGRKNAFSGMAIMGRGDFLAVGGMDESMVNYGCSDTDFTMTCLRYGLEIVYSEDDELHLWHRVNMSYEKFFLINLKSVCRFCRKWDKPVPAMFRDRIKSNVMM
jgi:hypothetical protein